MDESRADADPFAESLRIQAAAVVAQQAALDEQELRLIDRESALTQQEEQLAGRLEDQRRQLLELQDQITEARTALRQKRATHAALVEQQQAELAAAREAADELQRSAKYERQRLSELNRRLVERGRSHWQARRKAADIRDADLQKQTDRHVADRAAFIHEVKEFHGQAELDKRRLKEQWGQLDRERHEWQERRTDEIAVASAQVRDLARRAKAVAAAEHQIVADRAALHNEIADRGRELEQLENRIVNARWRLLEQQSGVLEVTCEPQATIHGDVGLAHRMTSLPTNTTDAENIQQRRAEMLARIADDLNDQRLHLAEQVERLLRAQQAWQADRTAALRELDMIGSQFEAHQLDLERRDRELQSARTGLWAQYQSAAQVRLRLEAEKVRIEAREADRRAAADALLAQLESRERTLTRQEDGWRSLLRRWGRRRRTEILRLRTEQEACRAERAEWAAARTVWLRLMARLREERRAVAARALAMEQVRSESESNPAGAKRIERLERHWSAQCEDAARDLGRLQATLKAEAVRLDELSRRVRQEMLAAEGRAAVLDDRAAEIEREEQLVAAERDRIVCDSEAARIRQDAAETQAAIGRDEAERLARLLIDAPPLRAALESSQAA